MDPRNHYTQSSSYFPFHSNVHLGESENPPFSSHQSEDTPAAKSKRNTGQGKSVAEYTTLWEMKKEDLAMKERLTKLAILDTLLQKSEPLTEAEEVDKRNMGLDYSYSQPSDSEDLFCNSVDSGYNETDDLIRRDQEEIRLQRGRRYYTCPNVDDGECHVWKWWDDALMEELRDRDRQVLLLSEKVDSLALLSDNETEQKVAILEKMVYDLAKKKSKVSYRFEFFLGVMVLVVVLVGVVQWFLW
ncbi:hypothetical protein IGI04_023391 [Brassica rapa subsp. trilocularis]|uniref:Zinc finger GRF-type domain-containing protein n=1 Tax=Brassica rapa subsp. trilocularis TaxID=1813537 RepID=A0ABQ7M3S3_BRACM|nr:hypothetical protein IGI04_023391 [Brassica rapa subsp. trilocularis]